MLLRTGEDGGWMQALAAFLALPATAFAWPAAGGFRVRTFEPGAEVEFSEAGLAAAVHAVWHAGLVAPGQSVAVLTGSGTLEARRLPGGGVELLRSGATICSSPRVRTVAKGEISWPS